jgi:thiosulfate dehydrogenase
MISRGFPAAYDAPSRPPLRVNGEEHERQQPRAAANRVRYRGRHETFLALFARCDVVRHGLDSGPCPVIAGSSDIDLTRWAPPDIATVGDDPFGALVKYGHALFTNTANEIGPTVSDATRRFAGNNLTCQNCHLQGGTQPYAMPLMGIWGQFPQYRAREGAVDTLEDRINGCMERSMNGRALPLEGREMKALSSYMRWLSTGIPDGAKLVGAGTLRIKEPTRAADLGHGAQIFTQICAACHGADGSGQRAQAGAGYQFPPLWGPTATTTAPE